MKKARIITLAVSLALMLCLGMASLASGWVTHFTPFGEHWSGQDIKFRSVQILYYQNNTSASIQLLKTNHWLWNTGYENIQYGTCEIYEGDGTRHFYDQIWWLNPIEPGQMRSNWYNFEPSLTYYKHSGGISVTALGHKPVTFLGDFLGGWQIGIFPTHFESYKIC